MLWGDIKPGHAILPTDGSDRGGNPTWVKITCCLASQMLPGSHSLWGSETKLLNTSNSSGAQDKHTPPHICPVKWQIHQTQNVKPNKPGILKCLLSFPKDGGIGKPQGWEAFLAVSLCPGKKEQTSLLTTYVILELTWPRLICHLTQVLLNTERSLISVIISKTEKIRGWGRIYSQNVTLSFDKQLWLTALGCMTKLVLQTTFHRLTWRNGMRNIKLC